MKFDTNWVHIPKVLVTIFALCYNLVKHISNANKVKELILCVILSVGRILM